MASKEWRQAWFLALVACFLVSGLALAHGDGARGNEEECAPGRTLGITRLAERSRLWLAFSHEIRARLALRFAGARMAKACIWVDRGDYPDFGLRVR
ncbi:MAG: hypothetical protein AB1445_13845 [Bacillota bacterium]